MTVPLGPDEPRPLATPPPAPRSPAAVLRTLAEARTRLDPPAPAEADITVARAALRGLRSLTEATRWSDLAEAAARVQRAGPDDLPGGGEPGVLFERLPAGVRDAAVRELEATVRPEAGEAPAATTAARLVELAEGQFAELAGVLDRDPGQVVDAALVVPVVVVDGTLAAVRRFVADAEQHAGQPAPATDPRARGEWVDTARKLLKEAYVLASNILVAAAFSLPSVQRSAQEAAARAGEAVGRGLPLLPSLLAIAIMAALGVRLARDVAGIRTAR